MDIIGDIIYKIGYSMNFIVFYGCLPTPIVGQDRVLCEALVSRGVDGHKSGSFPRKLSYVLWMGCGRLVFASGWMDFSRSLGLAQTASTSAFTSSYVWAEISGDVHTSVFCPFPLLDKKRLRFDVDFLPVSSRLASPRTGPDRTGLVPIAPARPYAAPTPDNRSNNTASGDHFPLSWMIEKRLKESLHRNWPPTDRTYSDCSGDDDAQVCCYEREGKRETTGEVRARRRRV